MAAGRYKAGTIFLDVAPSFDKVQEKIKDHVENRSGLKKLMEDQGREHGKAFAKGEAEGYRGEAGKILADQQRMRQSANAKAVKDASSAYEQMGRLQDAAAQRETAAVQQGAQQRTKIRRTETEEAKNLQKQINFAHGEALKEQAQRERAAAREQTDALVRFGKAYEKALKDRAADDKAAAAEQKKLLTDFGKAYEKALKDKTAADKKAQKQQSQRMIEDQALANAMHDGAIEARRKRLKAEADLAEKAEKERLKAAERAGREEAKAERKAQRDRTAEYNKAVRERARMTKQEAADRERVIQDSGGRIGRIIRKSVGDAVQDLPPVRLTADSSKVDRVLDDVRGRLIKLRNAEIDVDVSAGDAKAEIAYLQQSLRSVARTHSGAVRINSLAALASLQAVENKINSVQREARKPILLRVRTMFGGGGGGLGRDAEDGANAFRIFNIVALAVAAALAILGPLVTVVAAGLVTLTGAAMAGAAGLGVLALGFQGVFQAIGDQIKAEDDLGKQAATSARQRATAARQVRNAKQGLADAEQNAARATEDAARRVSDAERDLADAHQDAARQIEQALETQRQAEQRVRDAQEDSARAQRDLNEARREAKRDLEDLAFAYDRAKLDEKEAAIAIAQAQERLTEMRRRAARGDASQADVRAASVDVEQARLRAEQAKAERRRAGQDSSRARRRGVEGSDQVQNAQQRVADAARAEQAAQRDLQKATQDVGRTRATAARQVADAERAVTDALTSQKRVAQDNARSIERARQAIVDAQTAATEQSQQMSAAAYNAQQSMNDLSPAGQRFATFILGLRGKYKELRDLAATGFLPGLEAGMRELSIYEGGFRRFVQSMSKMWGDSFASMGKQLTNERWRSFFATMGRDGPRQAGLLNQAIFNVAETIAGLMDAFSPMTTEMLTWLESATAGWSDWAASLKGSPAFERFLNYVREIAPVVKDFLLALGRALIAVGVAMAPFAKGLLQVFTEVFNFIADMDPKLLGMIATGLLAVFVALQFGAGAAQLLTTLLTPLGRRLTLLVTVLTLVAFALIYFYQTNATARKYIDRFVDGLKSMGKWMLDNIGIITKVVAAIGALFVLYKVAQAVFFVRRAMMALGLTMKLTFLLNPYVLAIAALVGAIIYLWKTNESFRDTMKAAWAAIKRAMSAVVDWWTTTAAPAFGRAFSWIAQNVLPVLRKGLSLLGKAITWLWESVVRPYLGFMVKYWTVVFRAIGKVVSWLWRNVVVPAFRGIGRIIMWAWRAVIRPALAEMNRWFKEIIAPAARWLYKNVIAPVFRAIGRIIRVIWRDVIKPTFKLLNHFIKTVLGPIFRWLYNNVVKPIFGWIGRHISRTFNRVVLPIFRVLHRYIRDTLGPIFRWLWSKVVRPVFSWIAKRASWLWDRVRPNFNAMKDGIDAVKEGFRKARDGIKVIWEKLTKHIKDPINSALKFIQKNFIEKINGLLKKAGLDLRLPRVWSSSSSKSGGGGSGRRHGGGPTRYATGGMVAGHSPSPTADNIPAWLTAKEYVLPVKATAALTKQVGEAGLESLRRGQLPVPKYATGGMVSPMTHNAATPAFAKGGIVELGKRLQRMGYHVSEHPAFGGVVPGAHSASGYHYKGGALDINADSFNSKFNNEAAALDRLNRMLRSEGWNTIWRAANHYDHLHVDVAKGQKGGLGGFLGGIADKALDFITDKAKGIIDKIPGNNIFAKMSKSLLKKSLTGIKEKIQNEADSMDGGEAGTIGYSGSSKNNLEIGADMARKLGWTGGQWTALKELWRRESQWNHRATNPSSGAYGIPQSLPASKMANRSQGGGPDYRTNPVTQISWGLNYIKDRYGSPRGALAKHNRSNWYAKGTKNAQAGLAVVGENGPELMRFRGGEQVYNHQQSKKIMQQVGKGSGRGIGDITVMVENPWTGEYHEARMRGVVDEHADFAESVGNWKRR